jgi:hypothetical protein
MHFSQKGGQPWAFGQHTNRAHSVSRNRRRSRRRVPAGSPTMGFQTSHTANTLDVDSTSAAEVQVSVRAFSFDFWSDVGIDPIRITTSVGDFLTLRCYLDEAPTFLGKNGMVDVFRKGRAFRRYLASNPSNDMSSLSAYDDVLSAAIEGSLPVDEVTEDNIYMLRGLAEDIATGPDTWTASNWSLLSNCLVT